MVIVCGIEFMKEHMVLRTTGVKDSLKWCWNTLLWMMGSMVLKSIVRCVISGLAVLCKLLMTSHNLKNNCCLELASGCIVVMSSARC